MRKARKTFCLLLVFCLLLAGAPAALAAEDLCQLTAQALLKMVPQPALGATGGEWGVFGLARWGGTVPDGYFEGYLARLTETTRQMEGVLHKRKYTEYSRVIIALTTLGENPRDVGGYDLIAPLGDVENTTYQGINGAIYALIALDCGRYDLPGVRVQYLEYILDRELPGGGFTLSGQNADPDVTATALQALAPYRGSLAVDSAIERALERLSQMQNVAGGYESWGGDSCESLVQVIVALGELGISLDDERFVKSGGGLLDSLLRYQLPDGSFAHVPGGESNVMSTEQALYALVSVQRQQSEQSALYRVVPPVLPDAADIARVARLAFYWMCGL